MNRKLYNRIWQMLRYARIGAAHRGRTVLERQLYSLALLRPTTDARTWHGWEVFTQSVQCVDVGPTSKGKCTFLTLPRPKAVVNKEIRPRRCAIACSRYYDTSELVQYTEARPASKGKSKRKVSNCPSYSCPLPTIRHSTRATSYPVHCFSSTKSTPNES